MYRIDSRVCEIIAIDDTMPVTLCSRSASRPGIGQTTETGGSDGVIQRRRRRPTADRQHGQSGATQPHKYGQI